MKNKYGIGFFTIILVLAVAITCAHQMSYYHARKKAEQKIEAQKLKENSSTDDTVAADGHALKENCYYLMDVNGYVVVYLSDKKTAYEYTDIACEDLPDTVKEELKNGKYLETQEELYGFLENYSS